MLRYFPPKSQGYGHRVGRLTSVEVLERSERFLNEKTIVLESDVPQFHVSRFVDCPKHIAEAVMDICQQISASPKICGGNWPIDGKIKDCMRNYYWELKPDEVPVVAKWLDDIGEFQGAPSPHEPHFVAMCMLHHRFHWAGMKGTVESSIGPTLGYRALRTWLHFESYEHFYAIQDYLKEIGLVSLSEKHLRKKS